MMKTLNELCQILKQLRPMILTIPLQCQLVENDDRFGPKVPVPEERRWKLGIPGEFGGYFLKPVFGATAEECLQTAIRECLEGDRQLLEHDKGRLKDRETHVVQQEALVTAMLGKGSS